MDIKIALAGNPNCGKTTLFNDLTGSNQYVGNWPGVTVEKKEGRLKGHKDVIIQDLPGIYSLSPYTLEEVVARNYLVKEKPDAILNIVDGTNIERNLYLTTQLIELGLPVVVAVNMMDLVRKNGDQIDAKKLSDALGCQVVEISALKGEGGVAAAELAAKLAQQKRAGELPHVFTGSVEHAIAHIEESIQGKVDDRYLRWYAVKVFERDEKVLADLDLSADLRSHLEDHIVDCEKELDDDAESIITNQRYAYINGLVSKAVKKHGEKHRLSTSDRIDQIVTNRILALPIFAVVMFAVYWVAMGPFGTFLTDWTNDVLGTAWLVEIPRAALEGWGVNSVVVGLLCDGALAGVGPALGFVPQMLGLFPMLAILAALFFALYAVLGKRETAQVGTIVVTCGSFLFGSVELLVLLLLGHTGPVSSFYGAVGLDMFQDVPLLQGINLQSLPYLLFIGIVSTGLGYVFHMFAIEKTSATHGSLVFFFKPILAPLVALAVLGEAITGPMVLGIVFFLAGSLMGILPEFLRNRRKAAPLPQHEGE